MGASSGGRGLMAPGRRLAAGRGLVGGDLWDCSLPLASLGSWLEHLDDTGLLF